jgi:hypothetical protein
MRNLIFLEEWGNAAHSLIPRIAHQCSTVDTDFGVDYHVSSDGFLYGYSHSQSKVRFLIHVHEHLSSPGDFQG